MEQFIESKPNIETITESLGKAIAMDDEVWKKKDNVIQVLKDLSVTELDWSDYLFETKDRYSRNLVFQNDSFMLLLLVWPKGVSSKVHDHPSDGCWVAGINGEIAESRYFMASNGRIQKSKVNYYSKGGITWMHDCLGFHKVENASTTEVAVTLHVYSPPVKECTVFEENSNRGKLVKPTFDSIQGVPVEGIELKKLTAKDL